MRIPVDKHGRVSVQQLDGAKQDGSRWTKLMGGPRTRACAKQFDGIRWLQNDPRWIKMVPSGRGSWKGVQCT